MNGLIDCTPTVAMERQQWSKLWYGTTNEDECCGPAVVGERGLAQDEKVTEVVVGESPKQYPGNRVFGSTSLLAMPRPRNCESAVYRWYPRLVAKPDWSQMSGQCFRWLRPRCWFL